MYVKLSSPIAATNHLPAITWSDPSQETPHEAPSQEMPPDVPAHCHSPVTSARTPANHLIRLTCINSALLAIIPQLSFELTTAYYFNYDSKRAAGI